MQYFSPYIIYIRREIIYYFYTTHIYNICEKPFFFSFINQSFLMKSFPSI